MPPFRHISLTKLYFYSMKYLLMLIFSLSFIVNSSNGACINVAELSHCIEKVSDVSSEIDTCHDSTEEDKDDHSSENCDCHCHGHVCSVIKVKNYYELSNLDSFSKSVPFPLLSLAKLNDYHFQIHRPPIS